MIKLLKRILLIAAVGALLASAWLVYDFRTPLQRTNGPEIQFEIEEGQNASTIARRLSDQGVIRSRWTFLLAYRLFYADRSLKAGEYAMPAPVSSRDVLAALIEGRIRLHPLTVPEGLTRMEITAHLASEYGVDPASFRNASGRSAPIRDWDSAAADLEGYLFPETYHFPKGTDAGRITEAMVNQFRKTFNSEWRRRAAELSLTIRQVVILASLVEEEAALPSERELISAVFHNRLRIGMKLDCDPTIVYALKQEGRYSGRLRSRDLKWDSPYNTYRRGGLPPGPITNPGREALRAALYPADVDYLYFVSRNDGSHHFSRTFREHQNAVNKYQRTGR